MQPDRATSGPVAALAASLALAAAFAASCGDDAASPAGATGSAASGSTTTTTGAAGGSGGAGPGTGGPGASTSGTSGGQEELPQTFLVDGVVTDGDVPVEGAYVMQGGGEVQQVTGPDGAYSIVLTTDLPGTPTVVAAKEGYRSRGEEFARVPDGPVQLELGYAEPPDDDTYLFGPPGHGDHDDSTEFCGHCHTTFVQDFLTSNHSKSVWDPWVQDLYAGVASARSESSDGAGGGSHHGGVVGDPSTCEGARGELRDGHEPGTESGVIQRCYVGDGVLPDLNPCGAPGGPSCDDPALPPNQRPSRYGACADCHALGMDGPAGGRDLLDAVGVGYEYGNHCDACHHVSDVIPSLPPGSAGRLVLQRPQERQSDQPDAPPRQIMFGPFMDVPNPFMGGSYQPKFQQAVFCSGCHQQNQQALMPGASLDAARWPQGLPIHSTYEEWSESPYAEAGAPCQTCHMPPIGGMFNSVDVSTPEGAGIVDGFGRPAVQNRSHAFLGALQGLPRMIDQAVTMGVDAAAGASPGRVEVDVTITNVGAGHAVPTGEPLRSLVLLLQVDACGERATMVEGNTLREAGGALATGVVGVDVEPNLVWPAGGRAATAGRRLRVTRPTGAYLDYPGIGRFADPALTPEEKGVPLELLVADVMITGTIAFNQVLIVGSVDLQPGDRVWIGEDPIVVEGEPAQALAGLPGQEFARVTLDPAGRPHVPHHRAIDLASDHRVPASGAVTSSFAFSAPEACAEATVRTTLVYRRAPLALARERGWELPENVVASVTRAVALR